MTELLLAIVYLLIAAGLGAALARWMIRSRYVVLGIGLLISAAFLGWAFLGPCGSSNSECFIDTKQTLALGLGLLLAWGGGVVVGGR